jgi:hypothetical protein
MLIMLKSIDFLLFCHPVLNWSFLHPVKVCKRIQARAPGALDEKRSYTSIFMPWSVCFRSIGVSVPNAGKTVSALGFRQPTSNWV